MAKIALTDVTGGFNLSAINQNFQDIEDALNDDVLYRKNPVGEPNQMFNDLDMNGYDILNLNSLHVNDLVVNDVDLTKTAQDAADAEAAATAAQTSANAAAAAVATIQGFTGSMTSEGPFVSGTGFTPDVTTTLTLSKAYSIPANLQVHFDSEYQGPNTYSVSGNNIIFSSPIPSGVGTVYIVGGSTVAVETTVPSDGSVTDAKIATGSKLYNRINDLIDVKDYGATGNGVTVDTSAFTSALNAAATVGGTVVVPPGTYVIGPLTVPSGVTLKSLHGKAKLIPGGTFVNGSNLITIAAGAVNSEVSNFIIDLPTANNNSSGVYVNVNAAFCTVKDIYFPNAGGFGINLVQTQNCVVSGITIRAGATIGISAQNGSWNTVESSYVTGIVGSHHFQLTSETNSKIRNCQSYLVTGSGFGMNLNACTFCQIENCTTQDSSYEGINITNSSSCAVTGCQVKYTGSQSQDFGISIEASAGAGSTLNRITNCMVQNSGKSGIAIAGSSLSAAGNIIANNVIYGAGRLGLPNDAGILIYCNTGTASQNLVENNLIYGNGNTKYGVLESSAYGGTPNNNRIAVNLVTNITVTNVSKVGSSTIWFDPTGW